MEVVRGGILVLVVKKGALGSPLEIVGLKLRPPKEVITTPGMAKRRAPRGSQSGGHVAHY